MKTEFSIPSTNQSVQLHGICWEPDGGRPVAVVQLVHGMAEYLDRYDEFARFLNSRGIAVFGHDHAGHGQSLDERGTGTFAVKQGYVTALKDVHKVMRWGRSHFGALPFFLMGHSMGSFFARRLMTMYGDEMDGVVLSGTGFHTGAVVRAGRTLSALECRLKGRYYRSPLLTQMAVGAFDKPFAKEGVKNAWLSVNRDNVERYNADPLCGFAFTAGAYEDFFRILQDLTSRKDFDAIPKSLPVLLVSGAQDPVGDMGKGVIKVEQSLQKAGLRDVSMRLYEHDRHEILNEDDRAQVMEDIAVWLEGCIRRLQVNG